MSGLTRIATVAAALTLVLVACGEQKDTGLPDGPTPEPITKTLVEVIDSKFEPLEMKIAKGEEVTWKFEGAAPHNVRFAKLQEAGAAVDSHPACGRTGTGCGAQGETFKHAFEQAGSFLYFCVVHGSPDLPLGEGNMAAKIVVT